MADARAGITLAAAMLVVGACGENPGNPKPGDVPVFGAIAESESITVLGTEPFWSARIEGLQLRYTTPESPNAAPVTVNRFAGNGGLGFSGTLAAAPLQLAISPGACSDGMSDRRYPYTATLSIGSTLMQGCAYTDRQPFADRQIR